MFRHLLCNDVMLCGIKHPHLLPYSSREFDKMVNFPPLKALVFFTLEVSL